MRTAPNGFHAFLTAQAMERMDCDVFAIHCAPDGTHSVWAKFLVVEDMDVDAKIDRIDDAIEEARQ
jgi:hypothetical protein